MEKHYDPGMYSVRKEIAAEIKEATDNLNKVLLKHQIDILKVVPICKENGICIAINADDLYPVLP